MGTNFYTRGGEHIGKRSAAGLYCFDCGVSLKVGGEERVHGGGAWNGVCPTCGARPIRESLASGAAGLELGFRKPRTRRKHSVATTSSFTWAMRPEALDGVRVIVDEYGRRYSRKQFLAVLDECAIRLYDSVGKDFS